MRGEISQGLSKMEVYIRRNELAWNKVADKFMIILPVTKQTFILNRTAGEIIDIILPRGITIEEICNKLRNKYPDVSINVIMEDVAKFIYAAISNNIIHCKNHDDFSFYFKKTITNNKPITLQTFSSFEDFLPRISEHLITCVPVTVHMDVTYNCNLKCVHCYLECPNVMGEEISIAEMRKILKQLREMGTVDLTISGGEPFLVPNVVDIIATARELGFAVTVITNGTLLTSEIINALTKVNVKFAVSLYGISADVHDSITLKKGSFYKTWKAIEYLKSKNAILSN